MRELADELTPDRIFDRSWALTLLERVLDQLRGEYEEAGRATTFECFGVALRRTCPTRRSPPGWARLKGLLASRPIASVAVTASCFAARSPPRSTIRRKWMRRSGTCSLPWLADPPEKPAFL